MLIACISFSLLFIRSVTVSCSIQRALSGIYFQPSQLCSGSKCLIKRQNLTFSIYGLVIKDAEFSNSACYCCGFHFRKANTRTGSCSSPVFTVDLINCFHMKEQEQHFCHLWTPEPCLMTNLPQHKAILPTEQVSPTTIFHSPIVNSLILCKVCTFIAPDYFCTLCKFCHDDRFKRFLPKSKIREG